MIRICWGNSLVYEVVKKLRVWVTTIRETSTTVRKAGALALESHFDLGMDRLKEY